MRITPADDSGSLILKPAVARIEEASLAWFWVPLPLRTTTAMVAGVNAPPGAISPVPRNLGEDRLGPARLEVEDGGAAADGVGDREVVGLQSVRVEVAERLAQRDEVAGGGALVERDVLDAGVDQVRQ